MSSKSTSSGGIGFCGLLTIVFIVLKLTGTSTVATWSWLWVLSPLWLGAALFLALFAVFSIGFFAVRAAMRSMKGP